MIQDNEKPELWQENLEKARHHFKVADHMAYVTFTILKENRLMVKILSEIAMSLNYLIKAILQYEYSFKRVSLYKDPYLNLKTFKEKIAPKYLTRDEINVLIKIIEIEKKHELSSLEFVKKEKFVILIGDKYETLTIERIKEFMSTLKRLLVKFNFN